MEPTPVPPPTPIDGWKTKLGTVGMICTGAITVLSSIAALCAHAIDPANTPSIDVVTMLITISAASAAVFKGITDLGLGHKADKNTAAIKENTAAVDLAASTPAPVTLVAATPADPTALLLEQFTKQLQEAAGNQEKLAALKSKFVV